MTTDAAPPQRPRYTRQSSSPSLGTTSTTPTPTTATATMSSSHSSHGPGANHWPTRVASVESLHYSALPSSAGGGGGGQSSSNSHANSHAHAHLLKKRHSAYALSSSAAGAHARSGGLPASPMMVDRTASLPLPLPPLPDLPLPLSGSGVAGGVHPSRPPRNPARVPAPLTLSSSSQSSLNSNGHGHGTGNATPLSTSSSLNSGTPHIQSATINPHPAQTHISMPPPPRSGRSAAASMNNMKIKSRPSTAESTSTSASLSVSVRERMGSFPGLGLGGGMGMQDRQEITPWEFQSLTVKEEEKESWDSSDGMTGSTSPGPSPARSPTTPPSTTSPTAASLRSRASSAGGASGAGSGGAGFGSSATGPIEEVTPWELYPVPVSHSESHSNQPTSAKGASSSKSNEKDKKSGSSSSRKARSDSASTSNMTSNSNASSFNLATPTPYALGFGNTTANPNASTSHISSAHASSYSNPSAPSSASASASGFGFGVSGAPVLPPLSASSVSSTSTSQHAQQKAFLPHSPSTSTLGSASSFNLNLNNLNFHHHPSSSLSLSLSLSNAGAGASANSQPGSASYANLPLPPMTPSMKPAGAHMSTSTGPVEDVTPWELHPGPAEGGSGSGSESGLGLGSSPGPSPVYAGASAGLPPPHAPNPNLTRVSEEVSIRRGSVDSSLSASGMKTGRSAGVAQNASGSGSGSSLGLSGLGLSMGMGMSMGLLNGRKRSGSLAGSVAAHAPSSSALSSRATDGSGSASPALNARRSLPHPERSPASSSVLVPVPSLPELQKQKYHAARQSQSHSQSHSPLQNASASGSASAKQTPTQTPLTKPVNTTTATGPMEEVTPWELEDSLPPSSASPATSAAAPAPDSSPVVSGIGMAKSSASSVISYSGSVDGEAVEGSGGGKARGGGQARPRGSMTLEQLEEVMPWELYPAPAPALEGRDGEGKEGREGKEKKTTPGTQPSSSTSSQAQAQGTEKARQSGFSEFGLRRRRSTGGGAAANAASGAASGSGSNTVIGKTRTGKEKDAAGKEKSRMSTSIPGGLGPGISSSMFPPPVGNIPVPPPPGIAASTSTSTASSSAHTDLSSASAVSTAETTVASEGSSSGHQAPKFSTADRTILEQLKARLQAREAQFKIKGVGHTVVGGGYSPGKKHHPYDKKEVPYPRSYGKEVVDLDVWETMFAFDMAGSFTWHVFSTPPTKVLDIGCGTGTWILHCARTWKDCHFVGLDIVPLHPDLQNVGSPDLASRITWVQHNFLDGLPFQNEEFDFVHIKRIALGVPEDKWDMLFEEIARVMKPGAAFELVEEDLFFPGKPIDDDDETTSINGDDTSSVTRRDSISSDRHRSSINGVDKLAQVAEGSSSGTPTTSTSNAIPTLETPSRPGTPTQSKNRVEERPQAALQQQTTSTTQEAPHVVQQLYTPHSRSAARPALSVKTQRQMTSSDPYADLAASHPTLFGQNIAVLGAIGYVASQDPLMELLKQQKRERAASQSTKPATPSSPTKTKVSPFLLRSLPNKAPTNPRDHTILEAIWIGMLESRFVNLVPLSILTTNLEYHFKDVRTHPPLRYTFPPLPPKEEEDDSEEDGSSTPQHASDSEHESDDARDAVIPLPRQRRSIKSRKPAKQGTSTPTASHGDGVPEERRWLSMQALLQHQSPYVSLDESRGFAYSPSRKGFPSKQSANESQSSGLRRVSRLPNPNLNVDVRTLNLHLALRAKEIIACSESMWEWVQEFQAEAAKDPNKSSRFRSGSIEGFMVGAHPSDANGSIDLAQNAILEMTRDDFDHLLNNFEMDMQDKAAVGHALAERFDWHVFPSPILQDRKAFDVACEKYDKWLAAQRKAKAPNDPYRQSSNHHSRNSMSTPGLVSSTPDSSAVQDSSVISRSISSPQQSSSLDETGSIATTLVPTSNHPDSDHNTLPSPSVSHGSVTAAAPQRLSRVTRVFVAWKESDKEAK